MKISKVDALSYSDYVLHINPGSLGIQYCKFVTQNQMVDPGNKRRYLYHVCGGSVFEIFVDHYVRYYIL